MKVLAAMDSYKGSISAPDACRAVEKGVKKFLPNADVVLMPMADGGEGTVDAFCSACGGKYISANVSDVFGKPVSARYCAVNDNTVVIETAAASGIAGIPTNELDPMRATTFGTGALIRHAIENGYVNIILGLGSSATNDGAMGALEALGVKFYDENGALLRGCGANMIKTASIDASEIVTAARNVHITLACDVKNPFFGKTGAAYVYAPQKGATYEQVQLLDAGLEHFAAVISKCGDKDISKTEGAGAAGGLAGGLLAFTDATVRSGFEVLAEACGLEKLMAECDIVFTGEGRTDEQTAFGKLPSCIAAMAKKHGCAAVCLSGAVKGDMSALYDVGMTAVFPIPTGAMTLEDAMAKADENLARCAENAIRLFAFAQ